MKSTRREFLKKGLASVSALPLLSCPLAAFTEEKGSGSDFNSTVIVAKNGTPAENTRKAIEALGGIERFIKKGDRVLMKPNSISNAPPTLAVNTNPEVVREIVRLCSLAGAKEIVAMSHDEPTYWRHNGLGEALEAFGGKVIPANALEQYSKVTLPRALLLRETMVVKELLEFEVFINIPIAKHHAGSQLTLSMKNMMGLNWDRIIMHQRDIHQCIADLNTVRKPNFVVIDATRILLTNGPSGPGMVREEKTVIVSTDPIAADAYAATLFRQKPRDIRQLKYAYEMGLGEINTDKMKIRMLNLA